MGGEWVVCTSFADFFLGGDATGTYEDPGTDAFDVIDDGSGGYPDTIGDCVEGVILSGYAPDPPPSFLTGGTADGCAYAASLCYIIDGDYLDVLYYASGEAGLYTSGPWGCQQTSTGWFSTVDGMGCSTYQVLIYDGEYIGQHLDVPDPRIATVVMLALATVTSNSSFGSSQSNSQIGNGGHLYIVRYINAVPIILGNDPLQGGRRSSDGTLRQANFSQDPKAHLDPVYPLAKGSDNAGAYWGGLNALAQRYELNADYGNPPAPTYDFVAMNSNTWAAALLKASGVSDLELCGSISFLTFVSRFAPPNHAVYPWGVEEYSLLSPNFDVPFIGLPCVFMLP